MKTIYILIFLVISILNGLAQAPVLTIVSEEIPITEPAFSQIQAIAGGTPHTIRVYAEFPEDYELQILYGNIFNNLSISSPSGFYQDPNGGPTSMSIIPAIFGTFPTAEFDSWLTIGYEESVPNSLFILPIDQSFFDPWEAGSNLLVNDFIGAAISLSALPTTFPPNTPDENGQVILAQLTSTSDISACLNIQLRKLNPDGSVYDPPGSPTSETWIYLDQCFTHSFETPGCVGDFDVNGVVATSDLLLFMPEFGCTVGCTKDLTLDNIVTTADILVLLGYFGMTCD